jgi:hypothetical protein
MSDQGGSLDVRTAQGQKYARQVECLAGGWLAVLAAVYFFAHPLTVGGAVELIVWVISLGSIAALWTRSSLPAAAAIWLMTLAETVSRIVSDAPTEVTLPIIALLFSIQCLRGSWAARVSAVRARAPVR